MGKIELNHWFTDKNNLSISLWNFFVKITVCVENNTLVYVLQVVDGDNYLFVGFDDLESCINFVEETVVKCQNLDEVSHNYFEIKEKKLVLKK